MRTPLRVRPCERDACCGVRAEVPGRMLTHEQDASLGERYVSSSPHAAAVVESVHTAVLNRERASATNPSLGTAGTPEAEADPPEHVAAVSLPVVTSERDPSYRDGVQHQPIRMGRGLPFPKIDDHERQSRLSRWQEQR